MSKQAGITSSASSAPPASATEADDRDDLLFKALGHRIRRHLLDRMKAGPVWALGETREPIQVLEAATVAAWAVDHMPEPADVEPEYNWVAY